MDTVPFVEVRVTQRFRAPAERVFDAWIDPATAGNWLFATALRPASCMRIDARAGGSFCFVEQGRGSGIEHAGKYIELVRPRRLVFALREPGRPENPSRVTIGIEALEAGCELALAHENVLPGDAGRIEGRWAGMLYGLATILASSE